MLKFISRHKGIIRFVLIIFFIFISVVFTIYFENNSGLGVALSLVGLFLSLTLLNFVDIYLTTKAIETLNITCDYRPLFELSAQLLKEKKPLQVKQSNIINYALCLTEMGKFDEALNWLLSISIGDYTPINLRFVYYYNLTTLYGRIKNKDEAEKCYSILKEIYDNLLNEKIKNVHKSIFLSAESEHYFRIGEYEKALSIIKSIKAQNLYHQISICYLLARTSLKLNDTRTAKEYLNFVVKNGNLLCVVEEAKELLKTIEN